MTACGEGGGGHGRSPTTLALGLGHLGCDFLEIGNRRTTGYKELFEGRDDDLLSGVVVLEELSPTWISHLHRFDCNVEVGILEVRAGLHSNVDPLLENRMPHRNSASSLNNGQLIFGPCNPLHELPCFVPVLASFPESGAIGSTEDLA